MSASAITHRKRDEPEDEGWLITFADMSVLLMCFFVLLFSMSKPDDTKFKVVAEALRVKGFNTTAIRTEDPYEKLKQISMSLGASGYDKWIAPSVTPQGIDIELSSGAFFVPGMAKFTPEGLPMLEMVAKQILPIANYDILIEVEGHTDDTPVSSAMYPSNWELSAARASNVVRFLIEKGFPAEKLKASGRGGTMPKAPNHDAAGNPLPSNQDLNRRVVVKLIKRAEEE